MFATRILPKKLKLLIFLHMVRGRPQNIIFRDAEAEVRFVTAVTAGGSVKFLSSGVSFSIFTHFFVFLSPKLLKFSEIEGVKFLASGVNFSIFTHTFVYLSLKLLKLGEIDGVKFFSLKIRQCKFLDKFHACIWLC